MRRDRALRPGAECLEAICPLDGTLSYLPGALIQTGLEIVTYTPYPADGSVGGPAPIEGVIGYYTGDPTGPTATPPTPGVTEMTPGSAFLLDPMLPTILPTLSPSYGGTMAQVWLPGDYPPG
jgi:hypothetical protein